MFWGTTLAQEKGFFLDSIRDQRGFKFGKLPHEVLYHQKLSSNAKVVYSALDDHANKDQECFPGIRYMAKELGLSIRTIHRALDELKEIKAISVQKRVGKNGWSNLYTMLDLRGVVPPVA